MNRNPVVPKEELAAGLFVSFRISVVLSLPLVSPASHKTLVSALIVGAMVSGLLEAILWHTRGWAIGKDVDKASILTDMLFTAALFIGFVLLDPYGVRWIAVASLIGLLALAWALMRGARRVARPAQQHSLYRAGEILVMLTLMAAYSVSAIWWAIWLMGSTYFAVGAFIALAAAYGFVVVHDTQQ